MSALLRVALIGYGFAGKTLHAPLIEAVDGLALTVVSSRHPDKVRADLPGVEITATPQQAATHAGVDLVVLAGPNESHAPLAIAALQAGKHVVVDKPFTLSLQQAREVVDVAQARHRIVTVFQNRRWDSDFLAAQALLRQERLGRLTHFEAHYDRFRPRVQARWREAAGPGAGLWFDLGPHLIDQALQLFGRPTSVLADFARQRDGAETDDWNHVVLNFADQHERLRVILHASVVVAGGAHHFIVHGTKGSWTIDGMDIQESQLRSGMRPGAPDWGVETRQGTFYDGETGSVSFTPTPSGDYRLFYEDVRDAIAQGRAPAVTAADAIAVMAVLETAMASAHSGRALALPLTAEELPEEPSSWP